MHKTSPSRLSANKEREKTVYWTLACGRGWYNAALSEGHDASRYAGKRLSSYDQQNDLPEMKHELGEEEQEIAAQVVQTVLRRLDQAFQAYFRRSKQGEKAGDARFQGRDRYTSFTSPDGAGWKVEGNT